MGAHEECRCSIGSADTLYCWFSFAYLLLKYIFPDIFYLFHYISFIIFHYPGYVSDLSLMFLLNCQLNIFSFE